MTGANRPQSLLFLCSHNSVRSPMAEAIARHFIGADTYVASAGIRPSEPDPFAVAVMEEVGLDIARHRPHSFEDLEDTSFDVIVSLSPEAHHHALELTRTMAVDVIYWPTPDPTLASGARDQIFESYRGVRDGLLKRIRETFGRRPMGGV
ncbi:MAG: arsenate reductase ArsC [Methylobacteriaceae bacterium]|nr:arsenate reductase ArsC [Methylobacteriaceae bacterium]MBV9244216.1 arsenate reductase ArsC [Methylobacteriaceae bacterium]